MTDEINALENVCAARLTKATALVTGVTSERALSGLETSLVKIISDLGEIADDLVTEARAATTRQVVPFTPPRFTPVTPVNGDDVSEWDAYVGEDLWTLTRLYTSEGVRWRLYGTAVPSTTPFFVGTTHREARHSAHRTIRNHYVNGTTS